jgi:hypothetical protein
MVVECQLDTARRRATTQVSIDFPQLLLRLQYLTGSQQ